MLLVLSSGLGVAGLGDEVAVSDFTLGVFELDWFAAASNLAAFFPDGVGTGEAEASLLTSIFVSAFTSSTCIGDSVGSTFKAVTGEFVCSTLISAFAN